MNRAKLNFVIDPLIFLGMAALPGLGFLMKYVPVPGRWAMATSGGSSASPMWSCRSPPPLSLFYQPGRQGGRRRSGTARCRVRKNGPGRGQGNAAVTCLLFFATRWWRSDILPR